MMIDDDKREIFKEAWENIDKATGDAAARLFAAKNAQDALIEVSGAGSEPLAWCESCGLPFFEDDVFITGEDGIALCYPAMTNSDKIGRCFDV